MNVRVLLGALWVVFALTAQAIEPFKVKDIRVEGIQRTEAGTVFSYLPLRVGDEIDDEKAAAAIKALYATGFFSDVRLEQDDDLLIVVVQERPAIGQIEITGAKEFKADELKESLKQIGLAESRIYDKSNLDKAEKELKRQYLTRGRYAAEVSSTVSPLERNRVAVAINIDEGEVARIRGINIIGNQTFKEKKLLGLFKLTTPSFGTLFTKNDQYSKQKLSGDLEELRSFYFNQGYLEFSLDSTQVQISPDKQDIYITVNITEGPQYKISEIKVAGNLTHPEAEIRKMISVKPGDYFSREQLTASTKRIGDLLANDGYSFSNINAAPEVDKEKKQVAFTFQVDPGRRVYVRRINITGNVKTRDEVIRREMRQFEGGWLSAEKVSRSRDRVDKLGFFSEVNVETPAVPGTTDQVDVNVSVVERSTGSIQVGAGYSDIDKVVLSASISQNNVFGTGNQVSAQVNSGRTNRAYVLSYTNPYYTVDGVSRGFDLYHRINDTFKLSNVDHYKIKTTGAGVRYGVPVTETDTVNLGIAYERSNIEVVAGDSPQRYLDYVSEFGEKNSTIRADVGWARDTRNSFFYPTKGNYQRIYGEIGLPGADLTYYKLNYQHQWFIPISSAFTLLLNGELGYGKGYSKHDELPFFRNFYGGGVSSVRGFATSSLGPKDKDGRALGGNRRIVGSAELLFPLPGVKDEKSVRLSLFTDAGNVYGNGEKFALGELRYSGGIALSWFSPIGPLKLSFGVPIKRKPEDKVERFQFLLGTVF
ncbi:MAG: outer membrane protein assembly factor BamA [Burkholderiales bacterium]